MIKTGTSDGKPFRPVIPKESCPDQMANLIYRCWAENPSARPELVNISKELKLLNGGRLVNFIRLHVLRTWMCHIFTFLTH